MRAILFAIGVSVALAGAYLALGGASYSPAAVADPCAAREWRGPDGLSEVAEQIVLSGLDGAACELGVSREAVVLAFASRDARERFAREHGIDEDALGDLVRSGLLRAADDAERADRLEPRFGDLLRDIARRLPIDQLLNLLDLLPRG